MTNERNLDHLIRQGFEYGAGNGSAPDRWAAIAEALQSPAVEAPRPRSGAQPVMRRWWAVAAAVLVLGLTSSMLYPPVLTAATQTLRDFFHVLWEGKLNETPITVVQPPEPAPAPPTAPVQPANPPANPPVAPKPVVTVVRSVAEAAELAGFQPPEIHHPLVTLEEITVHTVALDGVEMRAVNLRYNEGTLAMEGLFAPDANGKMQPVPYSELIMSTYRGEQVGTPEKVNLGPVEALCVDRTFQHNTVNTHCQWAMDGRAVHLSGLFRGRMIELARTVVNK